jgi:hypothetical protein
MFEPVCSVLRVGQLFGIVFEHCYWVLDSYRGKASTEQLPYHAPRSLAITPQMFKPICSVLRVGQ